MRNYSGKTMSFKLDRDLEHFVYRFLENNGAELERNDKGFEALLPERLSRLLATPEYIRITNGPAPETGPDSGDEYSVNYGSRLLEKMVNEACGHVVPLVACQMEFDYLKSQGFERLIKEQLSFCGSVGRIDSWARIKTEYLFLTCRYCAQSDEQKEGLVGLVFNLDTGAHVPKMDDMLSLAPRVFKTGENTATWDALQIKKIMEWVRKQTKEAIAGEIGPFQESMTRRFMRDVANLEEYFASLKAEMEKGLERPGLTDQLIKGRREKIDLLPDELSRKKDELFKKYSIKVKIEPCAAMVISTLAIKILYRTSIGKKSKNLSLIYNPVTKSIDPLVCEACGRSVTNVHFCAHPHLICQVCSNRCPVCCEKNRVTS